MTWTSLAGISTPAATVPVAMSCSVFVDANDASDVFAQLVLLPNGPGPGSQAAVNETLWRSRDGGTTWQQLHMPQLFRGWAAITVAGTRIVALAAYGQQSMPFCDATGPAGGLDRIDDLYASDDGGITWNTIGQNMISKGLSVIEDSITPSLLDVGSTLFVQAVCEPQPGSATVYPQTYWRSTDNGNSWAALAFPAGGVVALQFTASPTGSFYGVAVVDKGSSASEQDTLLYSSDSGATWTALPSVKTLPGIDTSQFVARTQDIIAFPDGSVLAGIEVGSGYNTAVPQMFVIHPQDANPPWHGYAHTKGEASYYNGRWEIASTNSGLVLWGWEYGTSSQVAVYLSPVP
jgi:photosystem II stability/assembly factor-like uncharacterized protein